MKNLNNFPNPVLINNNMDYDNSSFDIIFENFSYENDLLKLNLKYELECDSLTEFIKEGKAKVIDVIRLTYSTVFLLENGEVYVTGSNTYGQFGNGTRQDSNVPVKANITDVKEIIAGGNHIVAIKNDNSVWSWGAGGQGQLWNAKIGDELLPVPAYELAR